MCEIEFRVWDKNMEKMGKVTQIKFSDVQYNWLSYRYVNHKGKAVDEWAYFDVDKGGTVELMQYTGLKIKGEKLFEHDRIRWRDTEHDGWQYGVVVWCGERDYPAFDVEPWIDCGCNGLFYIMAVCEAEIVGTKWDNPELLEELG